MNIFIFIIVLLLSEQASAVVNVVTPVPAPPNISFPYTPEPEPLAPLAKSTGPGNDYFETLFDEVEVAKTNSPPLSDIKLYDKLSKESVAYGLLKENPNLLLGPLTFRHLSTNAPHAREIRRGRDLIKRNFGQKSYNYKEITGLMSQQIGDPHSPISDTDWVLMSNAFRTLKAPGASPKANIIGGLLSEFILMEEIKKQEALSAITPQDRAFLSSLHYDLAQLYQGMYKNDENLFMRRTPGQLTLPIDPIYWGGNPGVDTPDEYNIPFDALVATRLDLLENSLLYDPYDDYAWAQLIDFAAFDLIDPWFYNQLTPAFWWDYFPHGFHHDHAERLREKWHEIHNHRDVREDHNIRVNRANGPHALRRLEAVYSRPTSKFNRILDRASEPKLGRPLRSSFVKAPNHMIKPHPASMLRIKEPSMSHFTSHTASQQQQWVPHHMTTQRPETSLGRSYRSESARTPSFHSSVKNSPHGGSKSGRGVERPPPQSKKH